MSSKVGFERIYQSSIVYFNWLKAYNDFKVYETFVTNARIRFDGARGIACRDWLLVERYRCGL